MGAELSQLTQFMESGCSPTGKHNDMFQKPQSRLHTSASLKLDEEAKLNHLFTPKHESTPHQHNISVSPHSQSPSYTSDDILSIESSPSQTFSSLKQRGLKLNIQIPQSSTTSADYQFEQAIIKKNAYKSKRKHYPKQAKVDLKPQQFEVETQLQKVSEYQYRIRREHIIDINLDDAFAGATFDIFSDSSPNTPIATNWCVSSPSTEPQYASTPSGYSVNSNDASMTQISSCYKEESDNELTDYDVEEDEYLYTSDEDVHCVENCAEIKRIIDALKWYSKHGDDHERLYEKMKAYDYGKQILNDYIHIMDHHLEQNGKMNDMNHIKDYHLICDKVAKSVDECCGVECVGYRRYLRWKHCKNVHQAQTQTQHEMQSYINTIDGLHCCFLHVAKHAK